METTVDPATIVFGCQEAFLPSETVFKFFGGTLHPSLCSKGPSMGMRMQVPLGRRWRELQESQVRRGSNVATGVEVVSSM